MMSNGWKPCQFELSAITMMFRDVADKDYIAARLLFRHDLDLQFLWCSLQALEKYLKAVLLYNGCDTRGLRHSLTRALDRVRSIEGVQFQFPPALRDFLGHLEDFGQNRYLVMPHYLHGDELASVDTAVWHIRRYCQYMGGPTNEQRWVQARLNNIHSARWRNNPERFRIIGGYLEAVLQKTQSFERTALVWHNQYYGARRRRLPQRMRVRTVSINPIHITEPGVVDVLRERVDFPKAFLRAIDEQRQRAKPGRDRRQSE